MKRRFFTMLLALVMVLSAAVSAAAAETGTEAALSLELEKADGETVVTVFLTGCDGVTNGRFSVSYDAQVLTLVGVQASDAYAMSSVNDETAGTVSLAWVGSQLTAEKTLMLTLRFQMDEDNTSDVTYTAESDGIFVETEETQVAAGSVTDVYEAPEDPTEPSEDPTEPSEDPTEPSEDPTEPSEDPTEPSEDPTEPSEDPTEPSENPTEPSEDPTEPSEEPTKPAVDTTELKKAIAKAKSLDESEYTKKSWKAMEAALAMAEKVLADENATQDQVDAAADALNKAIKALVPTTGKNPGTGDETMLVLPMVLAAASLMGIAALTAVNKRRNRA